LISPPVRHYGGMNLIVKRPRILGSIVAVALLIGALAAGPATAATPKQRHDTWVGQIVGHHRHFDYRGSYCPTGTQACIMILANFRIVPLTPQAATGLHRVAGRRAKLIGYQAPAPNPRHNGILYVRRVDKA
jgi:hypothetical protein